MLLMQIFKLLVLLGAALLPALATGFLALTSDPLRVFPLYAFHEVAVAVAVLLSLFVAYVAHQSYKKAQYPFLHFVALAYLGFAIVYAPHGALTHLADQNMTLFLIFGPASRLTVSTYLLLGLLSLHPRLRLAAANAPHLRWWPHLLLFIAVDLGLSLATLSLPIGRIHLRSIEALSFAVSGVTIVQMLRLPINSSLMRFHMLAQLLFAQSSLAFLVSRPWNNVWWLAHLIFAAGFLALGYAIIRCFELAGSFGAVYDETVAQHVRSRIIESSPVGIAALDATGSVTLWNPAAAQALGWTEAELRGKNLHELIHVHGIGDPRVPDDQCALARVSTARATVRDEDDRFVRKDGTSIPVAYTASSLVMDTQVVGAVLAFQDITERKRADEARARLIREQAARTEAEAAQRRFAFLAEASRVLAASLDYETTLSSVARLAVPALADWAVVHTLAEDGSFRPLAVAHRDPRKLEVLQDLAQRYPPDPHAPHGCPQVLRTGQPELIPDLSDSLLATVAREPEHLRLLRDLGLQAQMCVPLLARGRPLGTITLAAGESGRHFEPTDLALAEELARRAALAVDNARLYREAQEGVRVRDQFLSTAAHELKTPVAIVKGYAQLLRQCLPAVQTPHQARAAQVLDHQCDRLTQLVQEILEASQAGLGRLELHRRRCDLQALVAEVLERLQATTTMHRLILRTAGAAPRHVSALPPGVRRTAASSDQVSAPSALWVDVDRERIEQVLVNLLDNAIKFSPQGGEIELRVGIRRAEPNGMCTETESLPGAGSDGAAPQCSGRSPRSLEEAMVAIQDHGVGIPSERQAQVFERFYRAHAGTPYDYGGMGIGLYLSREIVARHGGRMWFESAEGHGSTFCFSVPLAAGALRQEGGHDGRRS